jgi:hypothetical protein
VLTEMGRDFFPVFVTLKDWADRWLADPKGPLTVLEDKRENKEIIAGKLTRDDGSAITVDDLRVNPAQAPDGICARVLANHPRRRPIMQKSDALALDGSAALAEPVPPPRSRAALPCWPRRPVWWHSCRPARN